MLMFAGLGPPLAHASLSRRHLWVCLSPVHPVAAARPTSVDVAPVFASAPTSAFTYVRPGTPIPSSVVDITGRPGVDTPAYADMLRGPALPTVVDVPRPHGLTPSSVDDVARLSAVDFDVATPAYGQNPADCC